MGAMYRCIFLTFNFAFFSGGSFGSRLVTRIVGGGVKCSIESVMKCTFQYVNV